MKGNIDKTRFIDKKMLRIIKDSDSQLNTNLN